MRATSDVLDAVRALVRERRGVDLSAYRPAMLQRRVELRILRTGDGSPEAYLGRLRDDPAEPDALVSFVMVKISRFFRVPQSFEIVGRALPRLAAACAGRPLVAWCAGCGAGEEAYSLAWLIDEAGDALPAGSGVLATDIDARALDRARAALYPADAFRDAGAARRAALLERPGRQGPLYEVPERVRSRVRFMQHDLLRDGAPRGAPFPVVFCRNVLIYFSRERALETQRLLAACTAPGGLLALGEAEWPYTAMARRVAVADRAARVFTTTITSDEDPS